MSDDQEVLRGAAAIAKVLGVTRPIAYHWLEAGKLDSAGFKKIGNCWIGTKRGLLRMVEAPPEVAAPQRAAAERARLTDERNAKRAASARHAGKRRRAAA